jgi:hypothetical protein
VVPCCLVGLEGIVGARGGQMRSGRARYGQVVLGRVR